MSLIKSNTKLRAEINNRIKELDWSQYDVTREAKARGFSIPTGMLNKYLKHGDHLGSLREDQIIWLATRLGIEINFELGSPTIVVEDSIHSILYEIPPYSEEEAIKRLKTIFPGTK